MLNGFRSTSSCNRNCCLPPAILEVDTMIVMPHSQDSYFHARRANHGSDSLLSWAVTHTHTTMAIERGKQKKKNKAVDAKAAGPARCGPAVCPN